MNKIYSRINWENYPSEATPLNEANLNKIDYATNEIDNRVISLDTSKLDKTTANGMVKNVTYNSTNGVFTVTYLNGTTASIDTKLEKMAVNFVYDAENERLVITLDDGTKQYVDMKALITQYEFNSSDTISFTISSEGKVQADVKNGAITADKLQPDYLADITVQAGIAQQGADNAGISAELAEGYAIRAEEAAEHAENVSDVQVMTPTQIGIGKPDNITIGVSNGTFETKFKNYTSLADLGLTAPKTCLEIATAMPNGSMIILSNTPGAATISDAPELLAARVIIERVSQNQSYARYTIYQSEGNYPPITYEKYLRPVSGLTSDWTKYLTTSNLTNNLLATVPGTALDAVQGKALDDKVSDLNRNLDMSGSHTVYTVFGVNSGSSIATGFIPFHNAIAYNINITAVGIPGVADTPPTTALEITGRSKSGINLRAISTYAASFKGNTASITFTAVVA